MVARAVPVVALLHIHIHLHHAFHGPSFDYAGLAVAAAASWIGVPGPGEPFLIYAGVLAAQHRLDIVSVVVVAWAAATVGGVIGWLIGLKAGRAVLIAPGPLQSLRVGAVRRGERVFERYAVIAILLTPSWVAGINQVNPTVYQLTNVISAAVWAVGLGFGAYLVGPAVVDLFNDIGVVSLTATVALVVGVVGLEIRRRLRRHRRAGARTDPGGVERT
jgi:membrane protein DedA with SNARE-associated domain